MKSLKYKEILLFRIWTLLLEEVSFIPDIDFDREEEDTFEYEFDKWLEKIDYIQMIRKGGYNRNKREFIRLDKETIDYYKKKIKEKFWKKCCLLWIKTK